MNQASLAGIRSYPTIAAEDRVWYEKSVIRRDPSFASEAAKQYLARPVVLVICLVSLDSCSIVSYGTRTEDLGDGKYRVMTPQVWDVPAENGKASQDLCPAGYQILKQGLRPDSAFNVTFLGSDYASYWIVQCAVK